MGGGISGIIFMFLRVYVCLFFHMTYQVVATLYSLYVCLLGGLLGREVFFGLIGLGLTEFVRVMLAGPCFSFLRD